MADSRMKLIKIKTGVVKRLAKEKLAYEKEAVQEKARIDKLKKEGKDEYVLGKQEEVVQESLMMVPEIQRQLLEAYNDLKKVLTQEGELKDAAEYVAAQQALKDAEPQLPKTDKK